jgi:uncharacterized protein YbaP (TraB family)
MIRSQRFFAPVCFLIGMLWLLPAHAADDDPEMGLLFRIGGGSDPACFLFGTIHSEDARVVELPQPVASAFQSSSVFVMEAIPDSEAIIRSMVTMVYTDGRSLEEVVGGALYAETVEAMANLGMPEEAIKDFKPWAVVTLLSVPPAKTGEFLDLRLYKAAVASGKDVFGLESIEEQLAVFENLTQREQVALLRETLDVREELPAVFERLIGAYLERDLDQLLRLSDEYLRGGDEELAKRFRVSALDVRNERMVERMDSYLADGDCFIAVGALHLPGRDGILNRLRGAGYQVERLY